MGSALRNQSPLVLSSSVWCQTDRVKIPSPIRQSGDGMEERKTPPAETSSCASRSAQDTYPDTRLTKHHPLKKPESHSLSSGELPVATRRKEPKFIPYEPYKAAVTPIVPIGNKKGKITHESSASGKHKINSTKSKFRTDLVEAHIPFPLLGEPRLLKENGKDRSLPFVRVLTEVESVDAGPDGHANLPWLEEKRALEEEIHQLRDEKRELESQFKIQTQVNAELKKLLVASVGEDMQTRVQFLSEDKAKLAEDIAFYSKQLLDDHEELERLSILCDVWRSKFMASSLMVNELAGWKAQLSRQCEEAREALQSIMVEHGELRNHMASTYRLLHHLRSIFDPSWTQNTELSDLRRNLLAVADLNHRLAASVCTRLLGSHGANPKQEYGIWEGIGLHTPAEEFAQKVLLSGALLSATKEKDDMAVEALGLGTLRSGHCFRGEHDAVMGRCRHCLGDVKTI